jgi:hypothetical protein
LDDDGSKFTKNLSLSGTILFTIAKSHMIHVKHLQTALVVSLITTGSTVLAGNVDLSKLPPTAKKEGVTYGKDIRPMLEASCFRCHTGEKPKAGLRLDSLEGALKGSKDEKVIVPGKSQESPLVIAVAQLDEDSAMPPKFKPGKHGPGGPGGPGGPPPGGPGAGAPSGQNGPPPGGPGGPHGFGPPPKPLTPEQVGLVRAWIDQGAK